MGLLLLHFMAFSSQEPVGKAASLTVVNGVSSWPWRLNDLSGNKWPSSSLEYIVVFYKCWAWCINCSPQTCLFISTEARVSYRVSFLVTVEIFQCVTHTCQSSPKRQRRGTPNFRKNLAVLGSTLPRFIGKKTNLSYKFFTRALQTSWKIQ